MVSAIAGSAGAGHILSRAEIRQRQEAARARWANAPKQAVSGSLRLPKRGEITPQEAMQRTRRLGRSKDLEHAIYTTPDLKRVIATARGQRLAVGAGPRAQAALMKEPAYSLLHNHPLPGPLSAQDAVALVHEEAYRRQIASMGGDAAEYPKAPHLHAIIATDPKGAVSRVALHASAEEAFGPIARLHVIQQALVDRGLGRYAARAKAKGKQAFLNPMTVSEHEAKRIAPTMHGSLKELKDRGIVHYSTTGNYGKLAERWGRRLVRLAERATADQVAGWHIRSNTLQGYDPERLHAQGLVPRRAALAEAIRAVGLFKRRPLTPAELKQRRDAAHAPRHPSETAPSVRQGTTGAPSRQAVALFRQGQQRPDTRARRGPWDTRSTERAVGSVNASFKLHFPKAYRSASPEPPARGRGLLAAALAGKKTGEPQDLVVRNPGTIEEAHRHPAMREIIMRSIGVVRDHQKGTIERGHTRVVRGKKLIPEGTRPGLVARAYKHAALLAIHKAGLGDYDYHMDDAAKAELRPLVPFMRYAHRRVFDQLHVANPGKFQAFKDEFGHEFKQRKHGKLTGKVRQRMRPMNEFIKIDLGDLSDEAMEKSWTNTTGVIHAPGSPTDNRDSAQTENARFGGRVGGKTGNSRRTLGRLGEARTENGHDTRSTLRLAQLAATRASLAHGPHGRLLDRLGMAKPVPDLPHGSPPIAGAATHIKDAAQAVEDHFGVPPIGNARLTKIDLSFSLGSEPPNPQLGGYNTNPAAQLRRAMHPRMRRRAFRLRLNTQRHLRSVLSGGITRQERWQLGATTRIPKSYLGKRSPIDDAAASAQHPTDAQAEAGNYRMGHASVGGLDVSIETPKGRIRRKVGRGGKAWSVRMPAHYGYIKRTEGADGDHVDVYLGPHAHRAEQHPVFVVDQQHADTKKFDEHKAMVGFRNLDHATKTYDAAFSDNRGPDRRRAVHQVTFEDFKRWVGEGDTTKPYGDLKKGLIGDAISYGANYLAPLGRGVMRSVPALGEGAGRIGGAARAGASRVAQSAVGQRVGRAAQAVAANPRVARFAARPRVAAGIAQARTATAKDLLTPVHTAGRVLGAVAGGERGAKIGGHIGVAADFAPDIYAAGSAGNAILSGRKRRTAQKLPGTLTQQAETSLLNKSIAGAALRGLHAIGPQAAWRAVGRSSTRTKVGLGLGAGAALSSAKSETDEHPGLRAAGGALAGGTAAALLTRGRAVAGVRRSARAIYTQGVETAREHLRVLAGATPSPHHIAQQHVIMRAIKRRLATQAIAHRTAGMAAIRPARKTIAAAAAGGAALAMPTARRNRWDDLQHPENP